MRKVVAYELLSLDGVAEEPDDFILDFDEVMRENLGRVIATQDAVLLGRRTYDDWARFWPTRDTPFADFINSIQKFVVTSTQVEQSWDSTAIVEGDLTEFVRQLKQLPGSDIGVHGSITLARSLLEDGLIDELRLVVAPSVQVKGRKLFDGGVPTRLSLTRCVTSPSGYLLVDFRIGI
ncbi:MAG: dihydrofolate reductase family protein [Acidimicrobiales bacterium]